MAKNTLVEKTGIQIKLGDYATANSTMLRDPSILPKVQDYRRTTGARMYPLDKNDIHRKIAQLCQDSSRDFTRKRKAPRAKERRIRIGLLSAGVDCCTA